MKWKYGKVITILMATVMFGACLQMALATDVTTTVGNSSPSVSIDSGSTVDLIDPDSSGNSIVFDVSDDNGVGDITNIEILMYRSDGSSGDTDDERDHWTITYDGSWSISPSSMDITVNDDLDTGSTSDTIDISVDDVAYYAAPSENSDDTTINDYTWNIDIEATDDEGATGSDSGSTEVNTRVNFVISDSSISASGDTGDTLTYSPNLDLEHDGNVEQDVEYSAEDQTSGDTDDEIPASAMYLDDDENHDESDETGLPEQNYGTSTSTYETGYEWETTNTMYNFVEVPEGIEAADYSGTITLSAVEG